MIRGRNLRQMVESRDYGQRGTVSLLREQLESGEIKPEEFSLRDLFENLVFDRSGDCIGREVLNAMDPRQVDGIDFLEAGNAVDTSAFSNITGQIVFSKMMERYNDPGFIWPQLCETVPTQLNGEKIPGIGRLGDVSETVGEGRPYPTVGLEEDWVTTPETQKRGHIVPVTKEAIFFDRTGLVLRNAGEVGYWLGVNKEKRVIDIATGQANNHNWKGTAYNTYYASGDSGPWINKAVAALADWTDINEIELLFEGMTDPVTGEPIVLGPSRIMLVPGALAATAWRVVSATEVQHVDNQANAATYRTVGANPIGGFRQPYQVVTSPLVYSRTSSATTWFYGDPKKAFAYMENWGIVTQQAGANSEADFNQDIVVRYKASERGVAASVNPRYMCQATAS